MMENIDTTICTELNASHVLAEALKQMDEIINGSERNSRCEIGNEKIADYLSNGSSSQDIAFLLKKLKLSIEKLENTHDDSKRTNYDNLDKGTCLFIVEWLKKQVHSTVKKVTAAGEEVLVRVYAEDGFHEGMWAKE